MRKLTALLAVLLSLSSLHAQVGQSSTTISQPADVKYNNGLSIGYRITKATGLTVNVAAGTTQCVDDWVDYAGGTKTMTDNTINYVVLDPSQQCAPVVTLGPLSQGIWWLAKVTTASGAVTEIKYAQMVPQFSRAPVASGGGSNGTGTSLLQGSSLLSGCGVTWTGSLNFTVSACTAIIAGTQYSAPQSNVTLTAADGSNPRIDVIAVNSSAAVEVITGTAASSPAEPSVDPATQLRLIAVSVATGATTPTGISNVDIYQENTEYTCAVSSNLACASTSNPYAGTKDIEATSAVATNNVTLTKGSGTIDLSGYSNLVLYVRSKATWANAKSLSLNWSNGATVVGSAVALRTGLLGFSSSVTTSYQQVTIPISSFGTGSTAVNKLKIAVAGGGGSIGFYIDSVFLQAGTGSVATNDVACGQLPAFTGDVTKSAASCVTSIAAGSLANSKLTNSSITVNGTTCTLGSSCSPAGSGAVGTTGSPASGELAKFSGAASITNGNLSGDCTTSDTLAITCTKTSGSSFASSATTDTTSASNISSGTLAVARGGTGTGSTLTGLVRGSSSAMTAAELSGDVTTSGSNAATIANLAVTNAKIAASTIDLTTKVTGILPAANGGNGNGFFAVSGPATSTKTFTFPNASSTVLTDNALVTAAQGGTANGFFAVAGPASSTKTLTFPNASATVLTDNAAVTVAQGGTGLASYTQGDTLYASGTTTLAALAKSTSSTRALCNTGTSNNPAWCQIDLTTGVTGILPVANGGTNNAFFTVSGPASSAKTYTFPNSSQTMSYTIASGAKALATSAISSAACSSAQTDTATGTASTDAVIVSFNGDPTAVTGYVPLTTGMLTIIAYPTTDTVNFKVCNLTSASITPGAITLNWRVVR